MMDGASFRSNSEVQPHSIEAEQQLLGAILLYGDALEKVEPILRPEHFFDPVHARIYEAALALFRESRLVSPVTIKVPMENDEGLRELGGPAYLVRLAGAAAASFAIVEYAQIITDMAAKRALIAAMAIAAAEISDGQATVAQVAEGLETKAGAVMAKSSTKPLVKSHLGALTGAITEINAIYMGEDGSGIPTGLAELDKLIGGLRPGRSYILAGRPSMGKSTVAQALALTAAQSGIGVFFAALEMTAEELSMRGLSMGLARRGTKIEYNAMVQRDGLSEAQFRAVIEEAKQQQALPIYYADRGVRSIPRLRSAVRRAQASIKGSASLGLVVIDYIQILEATNPRAPQYERVNEASDFCKSLAIDLNVPVLALSQLSRGVESRDPPIPTMADLRDSGKIEEDADVVILCYRDEYYLKRKIDAVDSVDVGGLADLRAALDRTKGRLDLIVAKQRGGKTGVARVGVELEHAHVFDQRRSWEQGDMF